MESVAGTLHDSLELKLQQPGRLELIAQQLFTNIDNCGYGTTCIRQNPDSKRHFLGMITKTNYYVRFFILPES
jgi:hypothetical protein